MYQLEELMRLAGQVMVEINEKWVPARPLMRGWASRVKDAWEVLSGKADAFRWPEGQ